MEQILETDVKAKIAELRQRYTKLALACRAAGMRVNPETVQEYMRRLQELEGKLG